MVLEGRKTKVLDIVICCLQNRVGMIVENSFRLLPTFSPFRRRASVTRRLVYVDMTITDIVHLSCMNGVLSAY
jgi:hypothetical protein